MVREDMQRQAPRRRLLLRLLVIAALLWVVVTGVRILMPPSSLKLAREAVAVGRFQEATESYFRHLDRRPEDWDVRSELALVLAEFDRPRALAEFRKIPPEAETYLDARRQMVEICIASERWQEAEQVLLELIERLPEDPLPLFTLAQLHFRQGRSRAALPFAERCVQLDSRNEAGQFLLAELLDDLGRTNEMIAPLQKVLELNLSNYGAHLNLAYAYAEAGRGAESRREAEWCLARNPRDVNALRFLALAARDEGNTDEAMREIKKALGVAPDDLDCRLLEAELLLFQKDAVQALARLKPLLAGHPRERRLYALLARAAAAAGQEAEAAEYRRQVQKLSE